MLSEGKQNQEILTQGRKQQNDVPLSPKTLILIRHGHSHYNEWALRKAITGMYCCSTYSHHDAPLTQKGREQVKLLRSKLVKNRLVGTVELIVSSPLARALDTAIGGFGTREENNTAVSLKKVIALPLIAERLDTACDIGKPTSQLSVMYSSSVDFSDMSENEYWWYGGSQNFRQIPGKHRKEPVEQLRKRIQAFENWIKNRPETKIAIVGHSQFFKVFTNTTKKLKNCEIKTISFN